jgi:hypothetical protein
MINSAKTHTLLLILIMFALGIGNTFAANSVVVIPMAGTNPTTQWALVAGNGDIMTQSGGISVITSGGGSFWLDFGKDLTGHAIVATQQHSATAGPTSVSVCGGADQSGPIHFCGNGALASTNVLVVVTRNNLGTAFGLPFYVAILP